VNPPNSASSCGTITHSPSALEHADSNASFSSEAENSFASRPNTFRRAPQRLMMTIAHGTQLAAAVNARGYLPFNKLQPTTLTATTTTPNMNTIHFEIQNALIVV
jgi:hypothetical protein